MTIRPREARDESALRALVREIDLFHAEALPALFHASFESHGIEGAGPDDTAREVFVAERDGLVTGFVDVRVRHFARTAITVDRRVARVSRIVVARASQRGGIGRGLMNAALSWARERRCETIELEVREFNVGALALYASLGFETSGRTLARSLP